MTTTRALIRCDSAEVPRELASRSWTQQKDIYSQGLAPSLTLRAESLAGVVLRSVDDRAADLVKIASYVFAVDQEVSRGGAADVYGDRWRRHLELCVPVSDPVFWQQEDVHHALADTLGFLTGDQWLFHFSLTLAAVHQIPLELHQQTILQHPDSVILFSGGADSLCTTVERISGESMRPVVVSHRSAPHIDARQRALAEQLRSRFPAWGLPHLSFWIHRRKSDPSDTSQRSRAFVFASLGAAVAAQIGVSKVFLGDNGFVSINPPINAQLVGTLASRATHPAFIARFNHLCSLVVPGVGVANPLWSRSRAEVLTILRKHNCANLLSDTVSCSHTRGLPSETRQCGYCSQCVDRRIGAIAAGMESFDPGVGYHLDIFTESLPEGEPRTVAESLVRYARRIRTLSPDDLFAELPSLVECILPSDPDPDDTANTLVSLLRRHAEDVVSVMDKMISRHSFALASGELPDTCLIRLATGGASPRMSDAPRDNTFSRAGKLWTVTFDGYTVRFNEAIGFSYLARLLAHPGCEFHTADLTSNIGSLDPPAGLTWSSTDSRLLAEGLRTGRSAQEPAIDRQAEAAYRAHMVHLDDELNKAEAAGDPERIAEIKDELTELEREFGASVGMRGRLRDITGPQERTRQRVTRALRRALKEIENFHPSLGRHLRITLKIGTFSSYHPDPHVHWTVSTELAK